jgi:hypothetical protein
MTHAFCFFGGMLVGSSLTLVGLYSFFDRKLP